MLDNVVEVNGLPLEKQREEIVRKRRHGMGFLGLGSTVTMLKMKYGSPESCEFTEPCRATWRWPAGKSRWRWPKRRARRRSWTRSSPSPPRCCASARRCSRTAGTSARRSRAACCTPSTRATCSAWPRSPRRWSPSWRRRAAASRHHSSIAPTGTISLSLANNASNGIEPSFAHQYSRNVIREGKKSKEKVDVFSFELLAYRTLVNPEAMPHASDEASRLPDYFISADDITPKAHVDIQAASQKWIDSSISKTANVPTDYPYEDFKDIYMYAHKQGLKGCTTFRFNPAAFQGVLVKETDLENTTYRFELEDGTVVEAKGNEEIEYDGELHSAANLFDALKEGYYGKF
jgi:ribonucleoside-diphosphate reductase alpha chain